MSQERLIGKYYDEEIFEPAFRRSARAIVAESYEVPDSPTGTTLQEAFIERMRKGVSEMPVAYYRLLEAFARGECVDNLATGSFVEKWKDAGDVRLVKLMMEMTEEFGETELCITDVKSAEKYFDGKFPEASKRVPLKLDLSGKNKKQPPKGKGLFHRARTKDEPESIR